MDEARQLRADRQAAVRNAWKAEAERVRNGMGTRNWTKEEQDELLSRGSVKGYEGHHMVSVATNPELASDPNNIQFLTRDEHINGAHQGNPHNQTNGYYNTQTKTMEPFEKNTPGALPTYNLSTGELMSQEEVNAQMAAGTQGAASTEDEAVTQDVDNAQEATTTQGAVLTDHAEDVEQNSAQEGGPGEGGGEDEGEER